MSGLVLVAVCGVLFVTMIVAIFSAIITTSKIVDAVNAHRPSDNKEPDFALTGFRVPRLVAEYKALYPEGGLARRLWFSFAAMYLSGALLAITVVFRHGFGALSG